MRKSRLVLPLCVVLMATIVPSFAEEAPVSRMLVMISGQPIPSMNVLYQYADAMDLGAIENLAKDKPTEIIPFQDLIAHLPQPLQGWTADVPEGMILSTGTYSYSFATDEYERTGGEDAVTVVIWDTVGEQMGPWFAFWYASGFYYENQDGYLKAISYKGYRGVEQRDHTDNSGHLVLGLVKEAPIPEIGALGIIALATGGLILRRRKVSREL